MSKVKVGGPVIGLLNSQVSSLFTSIMVGLILEKGGMVKHK